MKLGDRATVTRRFEADDVAAFAELTGLDTVPERIPEPLLAGLVSYLLGVRLPGPGTNYLKQSLDFHADVPTGAALTATVEVTRIRPEKNLCDLATTLSDAAGRTVASGRALVFVEDVRRPREG
jgi:3-hydroxybutyryl-CoA dehydratase